ncbi:alpha/beta hydrolase [Ktedonospora formicarum]|uniref:Alpha/beta hydrolase n=1 Tax=Ktedonospora formicarum TaxID=2778364 RepID=A0A8J3I2Q5_9CHLR|nr:alpha/beta hydrolase [Ktedonospora formicarum]GHO45623.1 alpha/beta hydrolase [Ktedonospora formicarum]
MSTQHRWTMGLVTGTSILGLTVTSGLAFIASRFVDEFSRPHQVLDEVNFSWTLPKALPEPDSSLQRAFQCRTIDGALLCGEFWAQPQPAPTIVLCHGYRVSRAHLRSVASLEYARGYNVLTFDFRGHGDSDSVTTSGGKVEVRDLEAALMVAKSQPETLPGRVIIHGFSMGAAVALLTPPHADVAAIIADSPYARTFDVVRRLVEFRLLEASNRWKRWPRLVGQLHHLLPPISWATVVMSVLVFRLRFGFGFLSRPDASFKRWQGWRAYAHTSGRRRPVPILLIHAEGDQLIPIAHARRIARQAKIYEVPLETYFVDGSAHCGAYSYNPSQYDNVLSDFLQRHLGPDFPKQHHALNEI